MKLTDKVEAKLVRKIREEIADLVFNANLDEKTIIGIIRPEIEEFDKELVDITYNYIKYLIYLKNKGEDDGDAFEKFLLKLEQIQTTTDLLMREQQEKPLSKAMLDERNKEREKIAEIYEKLHEEQTENLRQTQNDAFDPDSKQQQTDVDDLDTELKMEANYDDFVYDKTQLNDVAQLDDDEPGSTPLVETDKSKLVQENDSLRAKVKILSEEIDFLQITIKELREQLDQIDEVDLTAHVDIEVQDDSLMDEMSDPDGVMNKINAVKSQHDDLENPTEYFDQDDLDQTSSNNEFEADNLDETNQVIQADQNAFDEQNSTEPGYDQDNLKSTVNEYRDDNYNDESTEIDQEIKIDDSDVEADQEILEQVQEEIINDDDFDDQNQADDQSAGSISVANQKAADAIDDAIDANAFDLQGDEQPKIDSSQRGMLVKTNQDSDSTNELNDLNETENNQEQSEPVVEQSESDLEQEEVKVETVESEPIVESSGETVADEQSNSDQNQVESKADVSESKPATERVWIAEFGKYLDELTTEEWEIAVNSSCGLDGTSGYQQPNGKDKPAVEQTNSELPSDSKDVELKQDSSSTAQLETELKLEEADENNDLSNNQVENKVDEVQLNDADMVHETPETVNQDDLDQSNLSSDANDINENKQLANQVQRNEIEPVEVKPEQEVEQPFSNENKQLANQVGTPIDEPTQHVEDPIVADYVDVNEPTVNQNEQQNNQEQSEPVVESINETGVDDQSKSDQNQQQSELVEETKVEPVIEQQQEVKPEPAEPIIESNEQSQIVHDEPKQELDQPTTSDLEVAEDSESMDPYDEVASQFEDDEQVVEEPNLEELSESTEDLNDAEAQQKAVAFGVANDEPVESEAEPEQTLTSETDTEFETDEQARINVEDSEALKPEETSLMSTGIAVNGIDVESEDIDLNETEQLVLDAEDENYDFVDDLVEEGQEENEQIEETNLEHQQAAHHQDKLNTNQPSNEPDQNVGESVDEKLDEFIANEAEESGQEDFNNPVAEPDEQLNSVEETKVEPVIEQKEEVKPEPVAEPAIESDEGNDESKQEVESASIVESSDETLVDSKPEQPTDPVKSEPAPSVGDDTFLDSLTKDLQSSTNNSNEINEADEIIDPTIDLTSEFIDEQNGQPDDAGFRKAAGELLDSGFESFTEDEILNEVEQITKQIDEDSTTKFATLAIDDVELGEEVIYEDKHYYIMGAEMVEQSVVLQLEPVDGNDSIKVAAKDVKEITN